MKLSIFTSILAFFPVAGALAQEEVKQPTAISFMVVGEALNPFVGKSVNGKFTLTQRDRKYVPPYGLFEIPKGGLEKSEDGQEILPPMISAPLCSLGRPTVLEHIEQKTMKLSKPFIRKNHSVDMSRIERFIDLNIPYPNQFQNIYFHLTPGSNDWSSKSSILALNNDVIKFPKKSFRITNLSGAKVLIILNKKKAVVKTLESKTMKVDSYGSQILSIGVVGKGGKIIKLLTNKSTSLAENTRSNILIYRSASEITPVRVKVLKQPELPRIEKTIE